MQFGGLQFEHRQTLFCDSHFKRERFYCPEIPDSELLIDTCSDSRISFYFFSFPAVAAFPGLVFLTAEKIAIDKGFVLFPQNSEEMYWVPTTPFLRDYGFGGVIIDEHAGTFAVEETRNGLRISPASSSSPIGRMEFLLIVFRDQRDVFLQQIKDNTEDRYVQAAASNYFKYSGLDYLWANLINGTVYRFLPSDPAVKRFPCEQNALYLYFCFCGMKDYVGKFLYAILAEYVAYIALLRLSADGRWQNGFWTELNETHTRLQLDGIQLLCDFYTRSRRGIFREKAACAMEFLLKLAIPLHKGLWFLHDDLEVSEEKRQLHYNKRFFETTAFGKTVSCTLCLNTHIYTLATLKQLQQTMPLEAYRKAFEGGMDALDEVLSSDPVRWIYRLVYGLRDVFIKYRKWGIGRKLQWKYDTFLAYKVMPFLLKRFPRLVMPNGFIERDLCVLPVSDDYHIVNMFDLLLLYSVSRDDRLCRTIKHSMTYTFSPSFLEYTLDSANIARYFLVDILWLFICTVDDTWLDNMEDLLIQFHRRQLFLSPWIAGSPVLRNTQLFLKSENRNITILTSPCTDKIAAAAFNPSDIPQKTRIRIVSGGDFEQWIWRKNRDRERCSVDTELELQPREYAVLVRKDTLGG